MGRKNFHSKEFDKGTISKLDIFKEYFKESFPVFVHSPYFEEIIICDFFAGKGRDKKGNLGTALIILNELKPHCSEIIKKKKKIVFIFNDKKESEILQRNIKEFIAKCQANCLKDCFLEENFTYYIRDREFHEYFYEIYKTLKSKSRTAKLIYLDPCNFVIDKNLFQKLIDLPSADFLCFMPSSFLRRFPKEPAFSKFIDAKEISFEYSKPSHCHRAIADYFQSLIPDGKDYYIGCFSIQKGSNYYGLLFGSNHTLGAEKFQRVCWKRDDVTGEADYNIDRELIYDKDQRILFEDMKVPRKIKEFQNQLEKMLLQKEIKNDIEVYKFALKNRCLVKHSSEVLEKLMEENKIKKFSTRSNDIHRIKKTKTIELL